MRDKPIVIVLGIVVAAVLAVWLWPRGDDDGDTPATEAATGRADSTSRAITPVATRGEPATLEVTVRNAGGPLAGAAVRIAPEDGDVIVATTDAHGVARAGSLAPGTYEVSASANGHEPARAADQQLAAGDAARVELTLTAGGRTLSGIVTDASGGGGPIAGVRIDAAKLAMGRSIGGLGGAAIATTTTGADGRYQLTVPAGPLLVAARSPDYAPQARHVDVGSSGATADFALVPGGVIEGIVLDETTRQPVGGAVVRARRDSAMLLAESGGHRATAGADGRFRLTGMRPGAYELEARADARSSRAPTLVGLGVAEQLGDIQLLVGRGAAIHGRVVDEAGAPVAGATVTMFGPSNGDATTDARGAFVLDGVAPGRRMLVARAPDHVGAGITQVEMKDADVTGVVVRVQRGVKLRGRVEPPQVAEVQFEPEDRRRPLRFAASSVTTGPDGRFELGPIAPGAGTISARGARGDQGSLDVAVAPGMAEVVVRLTPGGAIAGRVVDGEGKPVAGASVMAQLTGEGETTMIVNGRITSGIQAVTGAAGTYTITGLAPGAYRMGVLDRGRPLRLTREPPVVKLAAAERQTGVDLAVERPDGVIEGVVTGPDGKPLADAWVSVQRDLRSMIEEATAAAHRPGSGPQSRFVVAQAADEGDGASAGAAAPVLTDETGRFRITGLAHSTYDVIAEAEAGKLRGRATRVTPDANVTIRALGVSSLSGTVRGPSGPASLFEVELEGPTRTQRAFTGGTFELGRVDPGEYTLRVTSSEGNAELTVTVAPNTPATVEVTLVANAVVVGTLVGPDGKPVADIPVTVVEETGGNAVSVSMTGPPPTSGPDGRFRIEHEAGRATLVVMTPPTPVLRRGLALEAGKTLDVGTVQVGAK